MRLLLFILFLFSNTIYAIEIKIAQGPSINLATTNSAKNQYDLLIHTIVLYNLEKEGFNLDKVEISLKSDQGISLLKSIDGSAIVNETQGIANMEAMGLGAFVNGQLLASGGLNKILGENSSFSSNSKIEQYQSLITTRHHFSLNFIPTQIKITAFGQDKHNKPQENSLLVAVAPYKSKIEYRIPVSGVWLMTGDPSIQNHHRLTPATEYAVDFFKMNQNGKLQKGDDLDASSYFAYGESVMSAADGIVVHVVSDQIQDRKALIPKDGEPRNDARRRVNRYNMMRYKNNFEKAAAGNIIVIKHQKAGEIEYSSYGHLKSSSVLVKIGDKVKAGEKIAEVGDTGDSATVHLHFQLNSNDSPFYSKSLPIKFTNLKKVTPSIDSLRFVKSY